MIRRAVLLLPRALCLLTCAVVVVVVAVPLFWLRPHKR